MFREGDIVEIPLPEGQVAIAWIIHASHHFKDAVGFIVFGIKGGSLKDVVLNSETGLPSVTKVLGPMYTNIRALSHYGWTVFAHQPISDRERRLTKREVGGGVYQGDEYLGTVEEVGEPCLKPMRVMGMPVVHKVIADVFLPLDS